MARLVTEFGKDIRYIAPWKKWVVWDDTHWEVDSGRTVGCLKAALHLLQTAAFTGATLCDIRYQYGLTPCFYLAGALVHTKGLEAVRNIYAEIYKTADYRDRMDIEKYAIQCESTRRWEAFVRAARWIRGLNAAVDDLDRNPWLLNVENGTVDLRTGELLPHRQEDMITKTARVRYDKNADCPKWKQFIREIMDYKGDLITFLQTAAG